MLLLRRPHLAVLCAEANKERNAMFFRAPFSGACAFFSRDAFREKSSTFLVLLMAWPLPMAAHAWRSAARQLAACAVEAIAATAPARAAPLPTGLGSPAPAALLQQGALASTEACSTSTSTAQQRALRLHHRRAWRSQLLREEGHAAAGRQPPPSCSCQHQHQQQWLCRQQQQHAWLGQAWRRGFATESAAPAAAAAATAAGEAARKAKTKEWSTAAELGMYGVSTKWGGGPAAHAPCPDATPPPQALASTRAYVCRRPRAWP